jgi:hypothetical protein
VDVADAVSEGDAMTFPISISTPSFGILTTYAIRCHVVGRKTQSVSHGGRYPFLHQVLAENTTGILKAPGPSRPRYRPVEGRRERKTSRSRRPNVEPVVATGSQANSSIFRLSGG